MIEIGQVVIENQLVSYRLIRGGPRTAIFLHGWRSHADVWKESMFALKENGITSYAINLPGFGGSEIPKSPFSVKDYERIVVTFMKKMDIPNAIVVGHSFGGRIAVMLSVLNPELVTKLILVDCAGIRLPSFRRAFLKFFSRFLRPLFSLQAMQGVRRSVYRVLGAEDYVTNVELQETFVKVIEENLEPLLPVISAPTLLVWGSHDTETPLWFAEIFKKKIPNSTLRVYEGASHFSFLDMPGKFVADIRMFIS